MPTSVFKTLPSAALPPVLLLWLAGLSWAQAAVTGYVYLHDPSRIIHDGSRYYVFSTGTNITMKYSDDLVHWVGDTRVFDAAPAWTTQAVPGFTNTFWAPDIVKFGSQYRLYYSVSTFGSQDSAIGLATNTTLDPADAGYEWVDRGAVIESGPGAPYNTIDPGILIDDDGRHWMSFGSYWNGIYVRELDARTGKPLPGAAAVRVAQNPPSTAIEASHLHQRGESYYLFVNWGSCCSGVNSTYNIRVGRSSSPTGPFLTQEGVNMASGGGTLLLGAEANLIGPGHAGIVETEHGDYLSYHYYDANNAGRSKLNIRELGWTPDGWPVLADQYSPSDFNFDGVVDGDDLEAWSFSVGATAGGDVDADLDTDGADFLLWQRHASFSSFDAVNRIAVAEPAAVCLLTAGLTRLRRLRRAVAV